jgi:hypothetical protein
MAFTHREKHEDNVVAELQAVVHQTPEKRSEQHPWTVLDDPSFRRLLRDGHRANATASLLSQLENDK